jgi:Zn-dependent protease
MLTAELLAKIILFAPPIILAVTLHEVAHGRMARRLGDRTAELMGRLSLNPFRHIDPVGTVILPLVLLYFAGFAFGWAKPVPVDWRNLHRPKRDMALVALAGPGANLLMLVGWAILIKMMLLVQAQPSPLMLGLLEMSQVGIITNAVLMVLNLVPIPPLDGSRVVAAFLTGRLAWQYHRLEPWGLAIVMVLFMSGLLGRVLQPAVSVIKYIVQRFIGI